MEFELPADFKEFLESLNRNDVRYLLIGGYAVGLHGYPRATNDIDVVVGSDEDNAARIINALDEFFGTTNLTPETFTRERSLLVMGVEPLAIDIINYLEGLDFDVAYGRRDVVRVEDIDVNLVAFEDLITNKRAVARPRDQDDIERLQKTNPRQ
jgi:hypothetical protein